MHKDDGELTSLAAQLGWRLTDLGQRVATAESCTGGWVAKVLTDTAGSSAWTEAGLVTYSNEAKHRLLGVSKDVLEHSGAVSEPVVRQMVAGALRVTRAELAVAISGVAGPGGGTEDKPVGTVWFAWGRGEGDTRTVMKRFQGNRESVRYQSVAFILDAALAYLSESEAED